MRARFLEGADHVQVLRQAEVVVAAKIDQVAAAHVHMHAIARFEYPARTRQRSGAAFGTRAQHPVG